MLTQAGVALGLARAVAHRFADSFGPDFAALEATVVMLNLAVGPPAFRAAITAVGEAHGGAEAGGPGPVKLRARPPLARAGSGSGLGVAPPPLQGAGSAGRAALELASLPGSPADSVRRSGRGPASPRAAAGAALASPGGGGGRGGLVRQASLQPGRAGDGAC